MAPDYQREFEKERQRLAQLWEAYEDQGAETEQLRRKVQQLEVAVFDRDKLISQLKKMLEEKDRQLAKLRSR